MKIYRAFKTELDLNNQQRTACIRHAGTARFAFNWGLSRKIEEYHAGKKMPTAIDLSREMNALKKTRFSWMYDVSKCAPQGALRDLDKAFDYFFRRVKEKKLGKKIKVGFPRFKSKKNRSGSFRLAGVIHVFDKSVQLPRLGVLRLKERSYLPVNGVHILSSTIMENLNVSGMMKNHHLAQAISDVGMYEFRRQLVYKGVWYGCQVVMADRFYPSSKRCSQCGHIKERLGLDECDYRCEFCGLVIDRDLNAAINLQQLVT